MICFHKACCNPAILVSLLWIWPHDLFEALSQLRLRFMPGVKYNHASGKETCGNMELVFLPASIWRKSKATSKIFQFHASTYNLTQGHRTMRILFLDPIQFGPKHCKHLGIQPVLAPKAYHPRSKVQCRDFIQWTAIKVKLTSNK